MSQERAPYTTADDPLAVVDIGCTMVVADYVRVPRHELEQEHTHLLGRLQQLRRLLGYPPLLTGKQLRREQIERR